MNNKKIDKYIDSLKRDFNNIEYKEIETPKGTVIELAIGKFFMKKTITKDDDYDTAVKRLFEDFMTNSAMFYIRNFWRL